MTDETIATPEPVSSPIQLSKKQLALGLVAWTASVVGIALCVKGLNDEKEVMKFVYCYSAIIKGWRRGFCIGSYCDDYLNKSSVIARDLVIPENLTDALCGVRVSPWSDGVADTTSCVNETYTRMLISMANAFTSGDPNERRGYQCEPENKGILAIPLIFCLIVAATLTGVFCIIGISSVFNTAEAGQDQPLLNRGASDVVTERPGLFSRLRDRLRGSSARTAIVAVQENPSSYMVSV